MSWATRARSCSTRSKSPVRQHSLPLPARRTRRCSSSGVRRRTIMTTQLHVDHVVNAKGQMCPMPILMLKKAWKDVAPGQIVAIAATDQGARRDIPTWAEATGNRLLDMTEESGVLTFYL